MTHLEMLDIRDWILGFDPQRDRGASLNGFLQFERFPRKFTNSSVLRDCFFYNVFIPYYAKDWSGGKGPPHPGLFADLFTLIAGRLVGADTLTLFVKSLDPDRFEELKFIRDVLALQRLPYILLPCYRDPQCGPDVGNLFFEWPVSALDVVVEDWFVSPQNSIEGYISRGSCLPRLCEVYCAPDSEVIVHWFLGHIEIGFRIWQDFNGIFLLSDKFDKEGIQKRIQIEDIDREVEEAVRAYDQL